MNMTRFHMFCSFVRSSLFNSFSVEFSYFSSTLSFTHSFSLPSPPHNFPFSSQILINFISVRNQGKNRKRRDEVRRNDPIRHDDVAAASFDSMMKCQSRYGMVFGCFVEMGCIGEYSMDSRSTLDAVFA